jgi:signal transduction histidine kinase
LGAEEGVLSYAPGTDSSISGPDGPLPESSPELAGDEATASTEDLRAELARMKLAQTACEVGFWEWELATGNVRWSAELERLRGIAAGSFGRPARPDLEQIVPEDRERVKLVVKEALKTGRLRVEYRVRPEDGHTMWLELRGRVQLGPGGKPARLIGISADISERKLAEERAEQLTELSNRLARCLHVEETIEALLELIVPNLADWSVVELFDPTFPESCRFVGRQRDGSASELIRLPIDERTSDHPSGMRGLARDHTIYLREVQPSHADECLPSDRARTVAGELGLRSLIVTPLAARGRIFGAIVFARRAQSPLFDKGDLRLGENFAERAALSIDNARLFDEAQRAREEAERAKEEAVRADQVKSEFLDMVSHEMRTPLMVLENGTRFLSKRSEEVAADERSELVDSLSLETERLRSMVENLLLLARAEADEPFELEPCSLFGQMRRMVASLQALHPNCQFVVRGDGTGLVLAHEQSLDRVLANLLSNALKYGGSLPTILATLEGQDGRVILRISDNGDGVPDDELPKIFDRFYRSPRTARIASGSGIGLPVCRRLVSLMGGEIAAHNRPGGGLEVEVSLTRCPESST